MKKRILLTSMSWENNHLVTRTSDDVTHYPIGLAYLHSYLESQGHTVKTAWLNNYPDVDLILLYKSILMFCQDAHDPEFIGFNLLTANRIKTFLAIEWVHDQYPDIKIILGGIHATIMYQQILNKYPYVVIVRGEGEITFNELVNNWDNLSSIDGIAYSDNGKVVVNKDRALIEDLDNLPFPKHELFFDGDREFACILTSRGCPNICSFCCLNPISKRKVRFRSVENVIAEIEHLVSAFPKLKQIWIHDDSFFLNNQHTIKICDEIIKRKFKVSFVCSGRFKPITQELITKLEEANFTMVLLGLESGNNDILEKCHKGITKDDVRKVTKMFKDSKSDIAMFLIVGLPGESEQTVKETYQFIQELQKIKYMYYHDIGVLAVYPGTEIYKLMEQNKLISDDYWLTDSPAPHYTVDNTVQDLNKFKEDTMNHISFDRIITWEGFKYQWVMIPHIIKYVLTYKRDNIKRRFLSLLSHK